MSCWWDDIFAGVNGDPPNAEKWAVTKAASGTLDIQSNALRIADAGGNSGEVVSYVETQGIFTGDFDVQVDWARQGDPGDGYRFDLRMAIGSVRFFAGYQYSVFGQHVYTAYWHDGSSWIHVGTNYTTSDTSSKFRITRNNSTGQCYAYWWNGSSWSEIGNVTDVKLKGDAKVRLYLDTWNNPSPAADVRFDNFQINTGCPLGPIEPEDCRSLTTCGEPETLDINPEDCRCLTHCDETVLAGGAGNMFLVF